MPMSLPGRPDVGTKRLVVSYVKSGATDKVEVEVPRTSDSEADQKTEAAHFVQTLVDNGLLDGPGATHEIISRPDGTKTLRRRGFSQNLA
jgi:hypothetical protein